MNLINCPECGKRISDQNKYCPECGCDLQVFASVSKTEQQKKKRFPKFFFIVLFVLLCASLCIGLLRKKTTAPAPEAEQEVQESDASQDEKPFAQEAFVADSKPENLPVGVYSGDDADILVIAGNGKAAYYCTDISYTELDCPWHVDGGVLSIELSKLHCSVNAKLTGNDFSTLILDSDSVNWNAEVFHRLNLQPEDYLSRSVSSCDPAICVQSDGTMVFELDGLSFCIPKHYIDLPDSFDQEANHFFFADIDAQEDYEGALMISRMSAQNASKDSLAVAYSGNFLKNVQVQSMNTLQIADRTAEEFSVSGIYNSNFRTSGGCAADGRLTVIDGAQPDTVLFVLWVQIKDRPTDNSSEYPDIISSIR